MRHKQTNMYKAQQGNKKKSRRKNIIVILGLVYTPSIPKQKYLQSLCAQITIPKPTGSCIPYLLSAKKYPDKRFMPYFARNNLVLRFFVSRLNLQ